MEQGRKRFTVRQLGMQNGKFFYLLFTSKLLRGIVSKIDKKHAFLVNNFTMTYPHKINPER